jgi:gentisate 1,2-dioxygenase
MERRQNRATGLIEEISMSQTFATQAVPENFFQALEQRAFSPGWAKKKPQMWPFPKPRFVPALWRYSDARSALDEASLFVSPEFAERRNLIMVNPIPDNIYPTSQNLVAAYQLVLPGETARSHRHTPNALRLILDAGGATYTIVNGVKIDVLPGDVVLTPSWHWHGHSNAGSEPAFWIDFLDVPLVQSLENMFFEDHPERNELATSHEPDSPLRHKGTALEQLVRASDTVTIAPGGLPTIDLHASGWRRGQERSFGPRIETSIFAVTDGEVMFETEGLGPVELTRGDVIVVPCWHSYAIHGRAAWSQMLRVSDAPVTAALGFTNIPTHVI